MDCVTLDNPGSAEGGIRGPVPLFNHLVKSLCPHHLGSSRTADIALMTSTDLLKLLKKSGLMSAAQMAATQDIAAQTDSADQLSKELVRMGLLTAWQAAQLLKGQSGFVLGHYRLLDSIGRGGMGHVFRAVDSRNSSIVAIKVMSRKLSSNQHLVQRFRREIRASSLLDSPHIVRSLDAGRVGNIDFMVMEYVNGDQLDNILAGISGIPVAQACEVIRQTALGLQHAYEQHMVHRDIKPSNLMLNWNDDGTASVRIMDMGLVRLLDDDKERTAVTRAGQVMGTPDYMSPEQGWNTTDVDIRSDIYSLGCTFFRMLTGRIPFQGDNPLQVLMVRCSKDAPSARSIRPELAEPIDAIVTRMTRRNPDERFQTPQELADAIEPYCGPITVESIQTGKKPVAQPETSIELQLADSASAGDLQDPGYRQFLNEMDTGAAVDLMMSATPANALNINADISGSMPVVPQSSVTLGRRRGTVPTAVRRQRRNGLIALIVVAIPVLAGLLYLGLGGGSKKSKESNTQDTPQEEQVVVPEATLAANPPVPGKIGEDLEFQPEFDGDPPAEPAVGRLFWRLAESAPENVTIDEQSGKVNWKIPAHLGSAAHVIPIELCFEHDDEVTVISRTQLVVSVSSDAADAGPRLPKPKLLRANSGELVIWKAEAVPALKADSGFQFRLAGDTHPDMQFDTKTGELRWQTTKTDFGRRVLKIQLLSSEGSIISEVDRTVLLLPEEMAVTIQTPTEQVVQPGQQVVIPLLQQIRPAGAKRLLTPVLVSASDSGISIDSAVGNLTWNVPENATGTAECTFRIEVRQGPDQQLQFEGNQQRTIVLRIDADNTKLRPATADVKQAREELSNLYRREFAAATRRPVELRQLLEISYLQEPGTADFALLEMLAEHKGANRIPDIILEAVLMRFDRYAISPLEDAARLTEEVRLSGLTDAQEDRLLEQLLRLAFSASQMNRWDVTAEFLKLASELTRRTASRPSGLLCKTIVPEALQLSESLAAEPSGTNEIKQDKLLEMLRSVQFTPIFHRQDRLIYVQSGQPNSRLPDSGQSLWTSIPGGLSLPSAERQVSLGFLDRTTGGDRWVLRLQIDGASAVAALILASTADTTVRGLMLGLDSLSLGSVVALGGQPETLLPRGNNATPPSDSWNDFEILVDQQELRLLMNGTGICQAKLSRLNGGLTGLMADRQTAAAGPALRFRNARILRLPSPSEK